MARPLRAEIPIYLATVGPKAVAQAFEIADGWLPILWSPGRAAPCSRSTGRGDGFDIGAVPAPGRPGTRCEPAPATGIRQPSVGDLEGLRDGLGRPPWPDHQESDRAEGPRHQLQRLAEAGTALRRDVVVLAVMLESLPAEDRTHDLDGAPRIFPSGLPHASPCQPSTQAGVPSPIRSGGGESVSSVEAVIAAFAGERPGSA